MMKQDGVICLQLLRRHSTNHFHTHTIHSLATRLRQSHVVILMLGDVTIIRPWSEWMSHRSIRRYQLSLSLLTILLGFRFAITPRFQLSAATYQHKQHQSAVCKLSSKNNHDCWLFTLHQRTRYSALHNFTTQAHSLYKAASKLEQSAAM